MNQKNYTLKTASKTYDISFQKDPLERFRGLPNHFLITDAHLMELYREELKGISCTIIPVGEASKNLSRLEALAEGLVQLGADRSSTLLAFGGGVVGDLTGFLASVYMRGIKFYQIPTSLLAMVDASIGGKTGVNLNSGKNLIGTFWHPEAVLIDPNFLKTLPQEHFINGMGEVVKYGVLKADFFDWLEGNVEKIMALDPEIISKMIFRCVEIKGGIVQADEREGGIRKLVNLGHTFGHALERLSGYQMPHGLAVARGMVLAGKYAGMKDLDRLLAMLKKCGLPYEPDFDFTPDQMIQVMLADKKNESGELTLILPRQIGQVDIVSGIPADEVKDWLASMSQKR